MFDRCTPRLDRAQKTTTWRRMANSFVARCVMESRDVAVIQPRQQCSPGKKENRGHDGRRLDKASGRIDCTEPLRDSLHGSHSTSFLTPYLLNDDSNRLFLGVTCLPFAARVIPLLAEKELVVVQLASLGGSVPQDF